MPRFVIEREVPGAGTLGDEEARAMARKSCAVLRGMPDVQWLESFVTDHKIYCIYLAPSETAIREHARLGGFPANAVAQVRRIIDPSTSE